MGNTTSQSDIRQENNQLFINESVFTSLTEYINQNMFDFKAISEQNCDSDSTQTQVISISNVHATGTVSASGNDLAQSALTKINCLSDQTVVNTVIQDIVNNLMTEMEKKFENSALSALDSKIKQKTEGASLSFAPPPESNVTLDQIQNITIKNYAQQHIANSFRNIFGAYFSINNVQKCKTNLIQQQVISVNNVRGHDVTSDNNKLSQSQTIVRDCIAKQNVAGNVTNGIKQALATKDVLQFDNKGNASGSSTTDQDTKAGDVFLNIGTAISNILSSFGFVLSSYASLVCACVCLVCCLLLCVGIIFMMMSGDGEGEETENT